MLETNPAITAIYNNSGDCLDEPTLLLACATYQCPPGDLFLYSQAEVEQFIIEYPNCTNINGSLTIEGNVTDLSPLNNVESINGVLYITGTSLTNLNGMTSLNSVEGYVLIANHGSLLNLNGLSNLQTIGGVVFIYNNGSLNDISGLQNIQINDALQIYNNPALSLCNYLNICNFLETNPESTIISNNSGDCLDVPTLSLACGIQCPPGDLNIYNQALLNQFIIDYPNCTNLNGSMQISGVSDLTPLNNVIESINGPLAIASNSALLNLNGLYSLNSVGGNVSISNNGSLLNLDGLSNLETVGGTLQISDNGSLNDISGIQNVQIYEALEIVDNPELSTCHYLNICSFLEMNPQETNFTGNSGDCLDKPSLQLACAAPLPLDLLSFSGERRDRDASLHWLTANEMNSSHFEIERSFDGLNFQTIGDQKAGGSDYAYKDKDVFRRQKIAYYRLKSVDYDGTFSYSKIIVVHGEKAEITIRPNPVKDQLLIEGLPENIVVNIYDSLGKIISTNENNGAQLIINTTHFPAGIYFIHYQMHNSNEIKKFIKN